MYPGIVDAHAHFLGTGQKRMIADLEEISSLEGLEGVLRNRKGLIKGRGWDQEKLGFFPTRQVLDKLADNPMVLVRRCGHVAVVNTKAVEILKLWDLDGLDNSQIETGVLKERALEELNRRVSADSSEIDEAVRFASAEFLQYGITSVHTDDYHGCDLSRLLDVLSRQRSVRIFEKVCVEKPEDLDHFQEFRAFQNDFFRVGAAKIYLDGSLGARTAAMSEEYADDKGNRGILYMDRYELERFVNVAEKMGVQLAVHVIGDRSLEEALFAFRNIGRGNPLGHRLIHVQVINDRQLKELKALDLEVDIQPIFYYSDKKIAPSRLGADRLVFSYRFGEMFSAGIRMALSTDSPVEGTNPFINLGAAEEFFDRKTAFELYTVGGRRQEFSRDTSELLPGEKADVFVLERDLFAVDSEELKDLRSALTFVNGRQVYSA